MSEDESSGSKYTVFNCVKSNYAHFIRNYFSLRYSWVSLEPFSVILSGGQPKMY